MARRTRRWRVQILGEVLERCRCGDVIDVSSIPVGNRPPRLVAAQVSARIAARCLKRPDLLILNEATTASTGRASQGGEDCGGMAGRLSGLHRQPVAI